MIRKKIINESASEPAGADPVQAKPETAAPAPDSGEAPPVTGGPASMPASAPMPASSPIPASASMPASTAIHDSAGLAVELLSLFGEENLRSIRESFASLNILSGHEAEDTTAWLARLLDSYFTEQQLNSLCSYYTTYTNNRSQEQGSDRSALSSLREEVAGLQTRRAALEALVNAREEALIESERKLKNSIPAGTFFHILCDEVPATFTPVRNLLLEDTGDDTMIRFRFVLHLLSTLQPIAELLGDAREPLGDARKPLGDAREPSSEEARIDSLSVRLDALLCSLQGLHIVNRRGILDTIARICSDNSGNFLFVSPESSLVVDPAIHDVKGLHGNTVKEGLSFAIIRRDSRQTIRLANITVI